MKILALGLLTMAMAVGPSVAFAKTTEGDAPGVTPAAARAERLVADSVVVTPQGAPTAQAAPAQPSATATAVTPAPANATAVAPAPAVVGDTGPRRVVHTEVQPNHNYMSTIALSALMGGVAGGLVGGAVYYLGDQHNAVNVAYWAAGGVLVGTGVGLVQLMVQENRVSEATALRKLPSDPAPTVRLALYRMHF
jgi:hypothetical protein